VRRSGELEPATDHAAMKHGDHGRRSELHLVQRLVPHARMMHAVDHVALAKLRQVETRAEVVSCPVQDDGAHVARERREELADAHDRCIVERIALRGPVDPQDRDLAVARGVERGNGLQCRHDAHTHYVGPIIRRKAQRVSEGCVDIAVCSRDKASPDRGSALALRVFLEEHP
jgi:hypothetical protein